MDPCRGRELGHLRVGSFRLALTHHAAGLVLPRHAHELACAHFVVRGAYHEATARGGDAWPSRTVLFKPAGEPHWNDFREDATSLRIEVDARSDPGIGALTSTDPSLVEVATRLFDEVQRPDELTPLASEGLCLELMAGLGRARSRSGREAVARSAAELLADRYRESVRFSEIAQELGVDRSHLARSFRRHHRCTMGDYLRRLRVGHVRRALRGTDLPLAEIAVQAGFADQSHCTRVFRRLLGVTPGRYRHETR